MASEGKPFRVVISGSRDVSLPGDAIERILGHSLAVVNNMVGPTAYLTVHMAPIFGDARGVDAAAKRYFKNYPHKEEWKADWDTYGKRAGIIRNQAMFDSKLDGGIVLWNGWSPGTLHMLNLLEEGQVPHVLVRVPG